jgi:acetoin utilization deacetylase AcuC-like enzyme
MRVTFDPRCAEHLTGAGHPERPQRIAAFVSGLEAGGCARGEFVEAQPASLDDIRAAHDAGYVAAVERFCSSIPDDGSVAELPSGDTNVGRSSFEIALLSAGVVADAALAARPGAPAMAVARPPGHHASPNRGMGFCIFNNVAVAAQRLRALRSGPVLIADFDYHHGNGTQAWVERALSDGGSPIGFISTHAYPAYPGTGALSESQIADGGFVVDVPLPLTTFTEDFVAVWSSMLPAIVKKLRPATIVVSAGFDFLTGDPIAGLPVTTRAVDSLCGLFGQTADDCGAALCFVLEGGYSIENMTASGLAVARDFGAASGQVEVPASSLPSSPRLRETVTSALSLF